MRGKFNTAKNVVAAVILITVAAYIAILRYQNRSYENTISRLSVMPGKWHKITINNSRIDTVYKNNVIKHNIPYEGNVNLLQNEKIDTIFIKDTTIFIPQKYYSIKRKDYGLCAKIFIQEGFLYPANKISPQIGLKLLFWHDYNLGILIGQDGYGICAGWHIYHQTIELSFYGLKNWIKNEYNMGLGLKIDIWDFSR